MASYRVFGVAWLLLLCTLVAGFGSFAAADLVFQDPGGGDPGGGESPFQGDPATHTFTSGLPPVGDGNDYPRSLNPSRQSPGGGASLASFFADSLVIFDNGNANPAYFDANNLLTRPATLIRNEAFWTDPKVGTFRDGNGGFFQSASFGFGLIPSYHGAADFGFDLAVASVSSDLPTGFFRADEAAPEVEAPFLIFDVQDADGFGFRGALVFSDEPQDTGFEGSDFFAEQVGTFPTLGSPRTAYEARFRFKQEDLQRSIFEANGGGFFDDGGEPLDEEEYGEPVEFDPNTAAPIEFFGIDLQNIATLGGTTQIAMDNFVLAGGDLPVEPIREPLTYRPFPEFGKNTPIYTKLDPSVSLGELPADLVAQLDLPADASEKDIQIWLDKAQESLEDLFIGAMPGVSEGLIVGDALVRFPKNGVITDPEAGAGAFTLQSIEPEADPAWLLASIAEKLDVGAPGVFDILLGNSQPEDHGLSLSVINEQLTDAINGYPAGLRQLFAENTNAALEPSEQIDFSGFVAGGVFNATDADLAKIQEAAAGFLTSAQPDIGLRKLVDVDGFRKLAEAMEGNETPVSGFLSGSPLDASGGEHSGGWFMEANSQTSGLLGQVQGFFAADIAAAVGQVIGDLVPVDLSTLADTEELAVNFDQLSELLQETTVSLGLDRVNNPENSGIGHSAYSALTATIITEALQAEIDAAVTAATSDGTLTAGEARGWFGGVLDPIAETLAPLTTGAYLEQLNQTLSESVVTSPQPYTGGGFNLSTQGLMLMLIRELDGESSALPDADGMGELLMEVIATESQREPMLFPDMSLDEYLDYLALQGWDPVVGDTGGYFEPIFDSFGNPVDFAFNSWIYTEGEGLFAPTAIVTAIPEPTTAVMLGLIGSALLLRRRPGR